MSHKVERLHAYPRAVCKRALLPTCCSDTPPTLLANRRWAAKCVVIQVRSCQVQRRADAVSYASCGLRRASSSPRRPVKQWRILPATAGKMTTHPTMLATCNLLAARGCADVSEALPQPLQLRGVQREQHGVWARGALLSRKAERTTSPKQTESCIAPGRPAAAALNRPASPRAPAAVVQAKDSRLCLCYKTASLVTQASNPVSPRHSASTSSTAQCRPGVLAASVAGTPDAVLERTLGTV
jgi:hypothetical protein